MPGAKDSIAALRVAPTWSRADGPRPALARVIVPARDTPRSWVWLWLVALTAMLSAIVGYDISPVAPHWFGLYVMPVVALVYAFSAERGRRVLLRDA